MYKFIKSSQYSYEAGIIISPILKENRGTERLTVMPKITQLVRGKSRNHIQAACLQMCNNSATVPLSKILIVHQHLDPCQSFQARMNHYFPNYFQKQLW